ncbi:MAG: enoyl-CoA hydratase [Acidimicrobiaceae bacterium]|nr:MAG: enoyl-CoA hydratase [Acidimicrobiaceae bacterium]
MSTPNPNLAALLANDSDGWRATLADAVLHIRLANPPVNAINTAMWHWLHATLTAVDDDGAVRSIVITSDTARLFSAGIDFKELRKDDGASFGAPGDRRKLVRETLRLLYSVPVPVVVGVRGAAFGAGAVLPALADLVVGGPSTTFTAAEIDRGIVGGSRFFARLVGEPLMRKMMLLGCTVSGADLNRVGAFAEFVADEEIEAVALSLGERLAAKHPVVMRLMKRAHVEVENMGVIEGYSIEQKYSVIVPASVRDDLVPGPSK